MRIYEHKGDVRLHRSSNSLVQHIDSEGHLPKWSEAAILQKGLKKSMRRTVEAAYIATQPATNHRDGFVNLAKAAGNLVLATSGEMGPGD